MNISCVDTYGNEHIVSKQSIIERPSAYGILLDHDTILLTQNILTHEWELPGGGFEADETPQQGLAREFIEETGLSVDVLDFVTDNYNYFFDVVSKKAWHAHRMYYFVSLREGVLLENGNNEDTAQCAYIPRADIRSLNIKKELKKLLITHLHL